MNKYFFIFPLIRNRKCKTKLRQSKQTILDDDVFNNEDLDDILFRHQDDEVLDEEDRPLKPPKKAKRKPRSKPAPGYGPAPDRKVYNCKYCEFNGKKLEWLAHLKSAHSDKNLVCRIANHGPKQVEEFLNVVGIIFLIKHWNCAVLRLIITTILVFHQNHHSNEIPESFYK